MGPSVPPAGIATPRPHPWALPAILLLGLGLRLWVAAHVAVIAADGIARIAIAQAFRTGGWQGGLAACLERGWHPLNPVLIWLMGGLAGSLETSGFAVSIAGGILGILGVYLLARECWGQTEGLLAALIWSLLPNAVHFSADILTEGQFLAFWSLAAWASVTALRRGSARWALAGGALGGLAYLTRAEGLGIPTAFALTLAVMALRERGGRLALRTRLLAAAGLGFLLLAFPYLLHLRMAKGQWMISPQKTISNTLLQRSSLQKREAMHASVPSAPAPKGETACQLLVQYSELVVIASRTVTPWVLALALLGLWRRQPWGEGGGLLLSLAFVHSGVVLRLFQTAGYASHRHFMIQALSAAAWAGAGLAWALPVLGRRRGVALAGVLCALLLAQACQTLREDKGYRREFGTWLGSRMEPDAWTATVNKPEIAYYARRRHLDYSANFPYFLTHPPVADFPQWLVLERGADADGLRIPLVQMRADFEAVPLPSPHDAHFVAFTRRR